LPLLLLALPGITVAAYAINQIVFPRSDRPLCTVPAIGIVLALLPAHLLALSFGSLTIGLAVAWGVIGAAGFALTIQRRREFRGACSIELPGAARRLGIAALTTIPIVLPTVLLDFFDDAYFNGHEAIIAHLQNGTYPPRYLYDPSLPLHYHYAFDLAGAVVTGLLRVRLDQAIDLLTIALWPCMFLLLWRVGEYFGGKRAGLLVALAVCFSGGWPMLCTSDEAGASGLLGFASRVLGKCNVDGMPISPPFIAYYFQHPWSIGVPIFCLVVLQRAALDRAGNQRLATAALVCSLSLLSLCQAVLFITTVAALGLTEALSFARTRDRVAATVLVSLGASLVIARLSGGFFVSGPFSQAGGLWDTGLVLREFPGVAAATVQARWDIASFGVLSALGIAGMFRAKQGTALLAILAAISLVAVNSFRYEYTWDIVKFGAVGFIALAIGAGVALTDLARWADTGRRRAVYGVVVIAVVGQGVLYPLFSVLQYDKGIRLPLSIQMVRPYFSIRYPVDQDNGRAVSFLRTHMRPEEIVYRTEDKSEPYAIWGGLPTQASVYPADSGDMTPTGSEAGSSGREKIWRTFRRPGSTGSPRNTSPGSWWTREIPRSMDFSAARRSKAGPCWRRISERCGSTAFSDRRRQHGFQHNPRHQNFQCS
jgi:hypothetical protein